MKFEVLKDTIKALAYLKLCLFQETPTFCDTETDGLYGYIRTLQVYNPEVDTTIYIIDFDYVDRAQVDDYLKKLWTVWQNASYDFGCFNYTTKTFDDTQWLARIAYPKLPAFSLDVIAKHLAGDPYKALDKSKIQKAGFLKDQYLSQTMLTYAATDVYALSIIWNNERIQKARENLAYKVDIISLRYSIEYQQNGLISDIQAAKKELVIAEEKFDKNVVPLKGLNPNSAPQCKKAFEALTGLLPDSTNKSFLVKQITGGGPAAPLAELVFNQRRLRLRITNIKKYLVPKLYTRFNPGGAATGRFTSKGGDGLPNSINAQNITRDLQYLFNQDTEDTVVVHADYSTAELRAACSIMQDETMYQQLMQGIDLHKVSAVLAQGGKVEDVTKDQRQKGKAISFGFIFGMSAPSFVDYAYENYGVKFTLDKAKEIKTAYQTMYPNITKYHKEKWNSYKTTPVVTPQGHINMPRLGTDAINHATQGCIAETVKLAVHYLVKERGDIVLKYLYNVVHDAIYLRVPKGEEEAWAEVLTRVMIKGWSETCKLSMLHYKDIPMPVEVEYNKYFNDGSKEYICKEII